MSIQGMPVTNRPAAFERVNPRSASGDANPMYHNLVQGGWLLSWIINRNHHGTDAVCGHRPLRHRSSNYLIGQVFE
jgi:hypothetical protein